jgi:hypothetical protein
MERGETRGGTVSGRNGSAWDEVTAEVRDLILPLFFQIWK